MWHYARFISDHDKWHLSLKITNIVVPICMIKEKLKMQLWLISESFHIN